MGSIAKKIVPLSFSQQRLWFLNQLESGFPAYNISLAYHVRGLLNIVALERSLGEIIKRHETLRTAFPFVNGQPIQCISQDVAFKLQIVDLREVAEANREVESKRLATKEDREAFDLQKGPLLRVKLLCLNEAEYVLLLSTHYIVCDTWSLKILMRELSAFYEAFCSGISLRLPELPIQYGDFAVWQCKWLHDKVLESQLAYWKHKLSGHLSVLELPTDRPRPPVQTYRGAKQSLVLPKCLTEAIKAFCQREGVTLFMTLLAAFKTLLYRYTGQEDIIVGSPIANRNRTEIKDLIGCFLNILVMRTDLGGNPTFRELVSQVSDVVVGAYIHQDLPFEKLIEEIQLDQVLSYNPLFQVLFVLQDAPTLAVELSYLTITYLDTDRGTAKFDLSLLIENTGKEFIAVLEYRTDLFDDTTVTRMLGHLQTLLKGIVANPEERISTLPILTEAELHQLLVKWNPQPPDPSWNLCYTHLFESQVQKRPNAVAVVFEDQDLTYQELDYRANQVGNHLRSLGVGPEVLVGICMERSLELAVGILGILKAGGACVPLAPEYPMERLALMLEDTQVKVLLTQRRILKQIPQHEAHVVCMDNWAVFAKESIVSPEIKVQPDNLAYVVYTSGSTGRPKGVMLTHRRFCGRESLLPSTEADRYLLKSGTLIELLWALRDGGRGIIARPGGHRDSAYLVRLIAEKSITVISAVPSLLQLLLEEKNLETCTSLKHVFCSGESLPVKSQERFFNRLNANLHHGYGQTETGYAALWSGQRGNNQRIVLIGHPKTDRSALSQIFLLDSYLQPVPIGVKGEIYVSSVRLARGYLNRPDLTDEKFIPNPFCNEPRSRLYKTGDLARYLPDGNIEFLGRIDHQIKLRGFRIELGEIETVLNQHPAVRQAAVIAREDIPEDKRLVAYIASNQKEIPTTVELRSFLKQKLPEYMIPSAFVILDVIPNTPNGKVDRRSLPAPDPVRQEPEGTFVDPRNELELQLTKIWEKVLGIKPIGVRDNFFDLGGHSLLAVHLCAEIEKNCGKVVSLAAFFQNPTVEYLAKVLHQSGWLESWSSLVLINPSGSKQPFFCVHGAGVATTGEVIYGYNLSHYLGSEQPFFGLRAQGLDGKQAPHTKIEDMANHYLNEIRSFQPAGPYLLGGFCFGGVVAFEMAQQLHAQGQKVALLALFDTFGSDYSCKPSPSRQGISGHWDNLLRLSPREKLSYLLEQIEGKSKWVKNRIGEHIDKQKKRIEKTLKNMACEFYLVIRLPLPQTLRYFRIKEAFRQAKRNYVMQVYSGKVTLFRSSDSPSEWYPDLGLGQFAGGGLDIYKVPGDHMLMLREPHIRVLAEKLRYCLDASQRDECDGSVSRRSDSNGAENNAARTTGIHDLEG